jgi:hypothetical protein
MRTSYETKEILFPARALSGGVNDREAAGEAGVGVTIFFDGHHVEATRRPPVRQRKWWGPADRSDVNCPIGAETPCLERTSFDCEVERRWSPWRRDFRELRIKIAIDLRLRGDELVERFERVRPLRAGQDAVADLSPKFLDLVVDRKHRSLLFLKMGGRGQRQGSRVEDREAAASAASGGTDLRSKLEGPLVLEAVVLVLYAGKA